MVDVSSQNNSVSINVSSSGNSASIKATPDTALYYSEKSREWAISDRIVDNTDYSSKYYANKAKVSEENARVYENAVKDTYNTFIAESGNITDEVRNAGQEGLNSIEASRLNAVDSINTVKDESIATVENKANEALTLVNNGITQINTTKNTAVDSINATKTNILKDIEFVADGEKEEIQELADKAKDDIESTGFYMRDDKLYFINSNGEEEEFKSGGLDDKITNCLLEVPQRIKFELNNGTLTIKAGSVVIVPYGTQDLTSQYPKGVTFLNNNFKVVDTQFADGKFFVWVELVSDVSNITQWGQTGLGFTFINITTNLVQSVYYNRVHSGATEPTRSGSIGFWYDTTNNYNKMWNSAGFVNDVVALPVLTVNFDTLNSANTNYTASSVNQVFNGMGYIGSTIFVDKGVKGLIPNGRNEDGTLNNIELVTDKVLLNSSMHLWGGTFTLNMIIEENKDFNVQDIRRFSINKADSISTDQYIYSYNEEDNKWYYSDDNGASWRQRNLVVVGSITETASSKTVSDFNPKQPFKAVDYNEAVLKSSLVDLSEEGSAITSLCMPDYSRATTWNTGGGIVPYDCLLAFYVTTPTNMNTGGGGMTVYINGVCVYATRANEYEATTGSFLGYAPKGANVVVTTKNNGTANYAYIIPLKGVN